MLKSNGFSMVPKGSYKYNSFQDVNLDDDIITGSQDLVPRDLHLKHTPVAESLVKQSFGLSGSIKKLMEHL